MREAATSNAHESSAGKKISGQKHCRIFVPPIFLPVTPLSESRVTHYASRTGAQTEGVNAMPKKSRIAGRKKPESQPSPFNSPVTPKP
jgi:hypothetical protein